MTLHHGGLAAAHPVPPSDVRDAMGWTRAAAAGGRARSANPYARGSRPAATTRTDAAEPAAVTTTHPVLLCLFLISLAVPVFVFLGPVRLSPNRIVTIALFVPALCSWITHRSGRMLVSDALVGLAALWGTASMLLNAGPSEGLEPAGIFFIETFGTYIVARMLIRNEADFRLLVALTFCMAAVMLPLAVVEALTDRAPLLELFQSFAASVAKVYQEPRFGLKRAQVVFEHSILFGTFCASALGMVYFGTGYRSRGTGVLRAMVVGTAAVFSVSTAAVVAIAVQVLLIAWNRVLRNVRYRWRLLGVLFVALYAVIDLLSNRTPFDVIVSYLTFSNASSYNRILIWQYGVAEVFRHPVFGIGLADWTRPVWMSSSMDNFWLVLAVKYGLPTCILFIAGVIVLMMQVGRAGVHRAAIRTARSGLLVSLTGLVVVGCTVHFWNAAYVWFLFLLGAAPWILDRTDKSGTREGNHAPSADLAVPAR